MPCTHDFTRNLTWLSIALSFAIFLGGSLLFSLAMARLDPKRRVPWPLRLLAWGIYTNALGLLAFCWFRQVGALVLVSALSLVMPWGYTVVHALFAMLPRYRKNPDFYLHAIKQVTRPKGGERAYVWVEWVRSAGLGLDPMLSTGGQLLLGTILSLPWISYALLPWDYANEAVAGALFIALMGAAVGFAIDLVAALLRYPTPST